MIIQTTPSLNQATTPDIRATGNMPVRVVSPPHATSPPATMESLKGAVAAINRAMQQANHTLEFRVDNDTHRTVVKMVDTSTGELIRQFPTESTLAIAREIEQLQQGMLLKQKA